MNIKSIENVMTKNNKKMTSTIKIMIIAAMMGAIIVPVSAMALEQEPALNAETELAVIQEHVDELFAAKHELSEKEERLQRINNLEISVSNNEKQSIINRIAELNAIVDDKTSILDEIQQDLYTRFGAINDRFQPFEDHAKDLRSNGVPIIAIGVDAYKEILQLTIDEDALTAEKDEQYYKKFIEQEFSEIPYELTFAPIPSAADIDE